MRAEYCDKVLLYNIVGEFAEGDYVRNQLYQRNFKARLIGWLSVGVIFISMNASSATTSSDSADFTIVTSIEPLALIVSDLLAQTPNAPAIDVVSLLSANVDPHHYALKVSDRKTLAEADLILWIGPEMERFLEKVMGSLPENRQIQVESVPGISWPIIEGYHEQENSHSHEGYDPHFWLNPDNIKQLQRVLVGWLTQQAGVNSNIEAIGEQWDLVVERLQQRMLPLNSMRYGVYHDGFRHFTQFFGLESPYVVSAGGGQPLSAKRVFEIQKELQKASCLLVEPGALNAMMKRLHETTGVTLLPVDILGVNKPATIAELIENVAQGFEQCYRLGQSGKE